MGIQTYERRRYPVRNGIRRLPNLDKDLRNTVKRRVGSNGEVVGNRVPEVRKGAGVTALPTRVEKRRPLLSLYMSCKLLEASGHGSDF